MTTLSLERLVLPRRSVAPRIRIAVTARTAIIAKSVRAAREFDSAASAGKQLRVMERFATSLTR